MSRTRAGLAAMAVAAMLLAGCSNTITKTFTGGPSTSRPDTPAAVPQHPASALAARLKAAGMPVTHLIVYTPSTDPNHELGRQGGYTSKVAWVDRRAVKAYQDGLKQDQLGFSPGLPGDRGSVDNGGGIEVFPTAAEARARADFIRGFGPSLGDGYDFTVGRDLLRLSNYLTPAQARAYKAAFTSAVSR
jgi:hypothetical protein